MMATSADLLAGIAEMLAQQAEDMVRMDGKLLAHRHVLGSLLSHVPDDAVRTILTKLTDAADNAEGEFGMEEAAQYRHELDAIFRQAMDLRA